MTRRAARALVPLAALSLGGCGGSVSRQDLEGQIAAFVHRQSGADIKVRCPDHVKPDKGVRVECTTKLSGAPAVIDIEFVDRGKFRVTRIQVRP